MGRPPNWVGLILILLLDLIQSSRQFPVTELDTDTCDHTVWDTTLKEKGVRTVTVTCSEGHVSWKHPYGALRIILQLGAGSHGNKDDDVIMEVCFQARSTRTVTKISRDAPEEGGETEDRSLHAIVMLNKTHPTMTREHCVQSKSTTIALFVEAQTITPAHVGEVEIDYDIQKVRRRATSFSHNYSHRSHNKLLEDDMEECRPCTNEELLKAVCSSDYVAEGSIQSVVHRPEVEESEVQVEASRIIRQSRTVFTRSVDMTNPRDGLGRVTFMDQTGMPHKGSIYAPHKCGVRQGSGTFLFTGRIRLGRALLHCAPRVEEFRHIWRKALQEGTNWCVLD